MKFIDTKKIIQFHSKPFFLVLFFILQLVACPAFGQAVQKKQLLEEDYDLMGDMVFHSASTDGKWCSYSAVYPNSKDTLFVQNIMNGTRRYFSKGHSPKFIGGSSFVFQDAEGLHVYNLKNNNHDIFKGVDRYSQSQISGQIAAVVKVPDSNQPSLIVIDKTGGISATVKNVTQYAWSPADNKILFIEKNNEVNSLGILELDGASNIEWVLRKKAFDFKSITWGKKGSAICFFYFNQGSADQSRLGYYALSKKHLYFLDQNKSEQFPADKKFDFTNTYPLSVSSDLTRVFFGIIPKENEQHNAGIPALVSNVEIWNANDKWIYPFEKKKGQFDKRPLLSVWLPLTGEVKQISSAELPEAMITADENFAVLSSPKEYEPQFDYDSPRDFYVQNIATGKKELFIKKLKIYSPQTLPLLSPAGRYVCYLKEGHYWLYNIRNKTHANISEKIGFPQDDVNSRKKESHFAIAGWTSDDKEIVVYDDFDLWTISSDGQILKRLTKGRESKIQFRLAESSFRSGMSKSYDGWICRVIKPENGLLLQARGNDKKTGFYRWENEQKVSAIEYKDAYIDKLYSVGKNSFLYQEQKFDLPARLVYKKGKTVHLLYQSNPHQKNYYWGKSELLDFSSDDGKKMQAVLYYPAQYDPSKKYPMVVNVYEIKTNNIYKYQNPTLFNGAVFNPTLFTNLGYFVLCPDIISIKQNEGLSAFNATLAAVNAIKAKGLVRNDKIGIIGHSFGGYETDFIITQTDIFAAAVAGSAVTNIEGFYHTVDWQSGRPAMNYFKSGQLKMDQPPSQIPEIYNRNSPIKHIANITTPLLSFVGKEDHHVDWHQSVEFYMALRRLGKKNILLMYPDEGHTIVNRVNQFDLNQRICEWFGYYLKDERPAEWIEKGVL